MDKYLIDGHKLFWHLDRVAEWQQCGIAAPIYVEISPVSLCNHRCVFCGIDFVRDRDYRLDTDVFCKRLKEMGRLGVKSVMFAGEGEPLLHQGLAKFVKAAKKAGMDSAITTNGALGNYDIWKKLLSSLTWIRFSVDAGNPQSYSKVHNVPEGAFNKTIESIKAAVKVKRDLHLDVTIGVQFLMIEENLKSLEDALNLFSRIGIDYFSLKPYSLHPQMLNKRDMFYTKQIARYIERLVEKFRKKTRMDIIFRDVAMEKYACKEQQFKHCYAQPFWGYVSSQGDFYTCSVFIGDKRFRSGNIYKQDMRRILFGTRRKNAIAYAANELVVGRECRVNCRMSRINESLEIVSHKPEHINFI